MKEILLALLAFLISVFRIRRTMQLEIPAPWAFAGPNNGLALKSDRNKYRVFQFVVWACRSGLGDVKPNTRLGHR